VLISRRSRDLKHREERTETVAGPQARSIPTGDYSTKESVGKRRSRRVARPPATPLG